MPKKTPDTFGKIMTASYLFALATLALLAVAAFFILKQGIKTMATDAAVINVAGRQRMLSQRISHLYLRLISVQDKTEREGLFKDIANAINLMEQSHQALLNGSAAMGLFGKPSKEAQALYFNPPISLDKKLHEFINYGRTVLYSKDREITIDNPSLKYIISISHEELLDVLDMVVKQYEKEAEGRVARLEKTETLLLFTGMLVLVLIGSFIFRPTVRRVETAEESLRQSNQRLGALIEASPLAIVSLDPDGYVKLWNPACERVFGWKKEEVLDKILPTVPEEAKEEFRMLRGRILKEGEGFSNLEVRRQRKDGRLIDISLSTAPLLGAEGRVTGMLGIMDDITQRKDTEYALKASEENLRLLVGNLPDCVCHISLSGRFLSVNEAGCKINEIERVEDVIGTHYLDNVAKENRRELEQAFNDALGSGKTASLHFKSITNSGKEIWWDSKLTPLKDKEGKISSVLRVSRDITEIKKIQDALKVSEEYFRLLVENMPDCVCRLDFDGKIISMNKAGALTEGFEKPEDVLGYRRADHVVLDNRREFEEAARRAAAGETVSVQYKAVTQKGKEIWWDSTLTPLRDVQGNITSILRVSRDISERVIAQERQKNIVLGLHAVMEMADELIFCKDTDTLLKMAVEQARARLKLERCAIFLGTDGDMRGTYGTDRHGNTTDEHNHHFPKKGAWSKDKQLARSAEGQWIIVKEPYLEWDGEKNVEIGGEGWIAITPIESAQKQIGVFINDSVISHKPLDPLQQEILSVLSSLLGNIIERKRFEEDLAKINEFNVSLLRAIPFGMDIVDEKANILYANDTFKKLVGFDPTGRKCFEIYKDDKQQCESCPLKEEVSGGEVRYIETSGVLEGRIYRIAHIGMFYEGKKAVLEIFEDVTTQKEAEQRLREAVALKTEFVSMVSHELRTPLTAIKEGIAIVADESAGMVNAEQKNFLGIAQRNVMRLARFINNVLDYQKLDSGRMEFSIAPNDINEVVQEVKNDLILHAQNKELDFRLELAPGLPKTGFDRDKISQVLYNLVYNAVKFTQKGFVCLRTEKIDDTIRVSVQDTGIGIKREDSRKLFRDFSQLATGKDRLTGSTGLGLAISRKLVIHHGGQIWFESEFGKGSTFYFTLPIR